METYICKTQDKHYRGYSWAVAAAALEVVVFLEQSELATDSQDEQETVVPGSAFLETNMNQIE